jgi:hypothetical protein
MSPHFLPTFSTFLHLFEAFSGLNFMKQCIEVTRRPKMPKNGKSPSDAHICGAERCKVAVGGWRLVV